jgi:hypothetical protein
VIAAASCAARGSLPGLPRSDVPLTRDAPPTPRPPREGPFDSTASREVVVLVTTGREEVELRAFCRVGVWTTLDRTRAYGFVTRETWGRLGERRPRRLRQIPDQALAGVIVRVRPEARGALSFRAEIADVEMAPSRNVDVYHGQRVSLSDPRRRGYRFEGRAPAGWTGAVARWGDVAVHVGAVAAADADAGVPPGALHFASGDESGFVAGAEPAAEVFSETWEVAEPIHIVADGVERKDYRLTKVRAAAGFRTPGGRAPQEFGAAFRFRRE